RIAAVATAVPPYRYTQAQILALAGYADARRRGFFAASDIEGRHLWIDPARFTPNETVDDLNARFREGALALAESAARAALERAVAHAIFADGAGALALGGDHPRGPAIIGHRTLFSSEHLSAMGFEYPGGRPRVVLSKDVRRIGATMMGEMARVLMETQGLKRADVAHWVLHSAGRRVLDRARVRRVAAAAPHERTLCVVDVGGGDGAFARRVASWARRAGRRVRVLVVEDDEATARLATAECAAYPEIVVLRADATALPLAAGAADVVHAALTLHHLEPADAVAALSEMGRACRGPPGVNDLARTA